MLDVGYIISGNEIEIHVDFIPPSPIFNQLSSGKVHTVTLGESIPLSWSEVPDHGWYSVIVQDADGVVTEVFNGSENTTTLTDLSLGQNRLRVNVMVDGKISEYSDSIFISINEPADEASEEENSLPAVSISLTVTVLLAACIIHSRRRS